MFPRTLSSCRCRCNAQRFSFSAHRYSTAHGQNRGIIEMLKSERDMEQGNAVPNGYKLRTYNHAIEQLSEIDYPIESAKDLRSIDGIGPGITRRILEYVSMGTPSNLALAAEAERTRVIEELRTLPKLGPVKAEQLYKAGCRGLQDIMKEKYLSMLSPNQQTHIRHAEAISQGATAEEAQQLAAFVQQSLPSEWEVIPTGPIRRGEPSDPTGIHLLLIHPESGLITPPPIPYPDLEDGKSSKRLKSIPDPTIPKSNYPMHKLVIPTLHELAVLVEKASTKHTELTGLVRIPEQLGDTDWEALMTRKEGVKFQSGTLRKARLIAAPLKSRGATLLAETGDQKMWKSMCTRAHKLGMLLSPSGLWKWRADTTSMVDDPSKGYWELLQSSTEEEIFEQIGMEWVDPKSRNIGFVL